MKNKTKLNILLSLMLLATPGVAQTPDKDKQKRENRAREFANFALYWSEYDAVYGARTRDIRRAERTPYVQAQAVIPALVRDSTRLANGVVRYADAINEIYDLNESPEFPFALYECVYVYQENAATPDSKIYQMGKYLKEYDQVLRKLKLARYTIRHNDNHK